MRKSLVVGSVVGLLLVGLVLAVSWETGYGWGSSVATYVEVTCQPVGGPPLPTCSGMSVTVKLSYGDGSYVGTKQDTYRRWWWPFGENTLSFYFGILEQRRGFIVDLGSGRSCSFPPRSWVWWNRVLRITIKSTGELVKCYEG